jgi:hypothetical protein
MHSKARFSPPSGLRAVAQTRHAPKTGAGGAALGPRSLPAARARVGKVCIATVTLAGCPEYLTDVSQALTTYSEEMDDKRSARAEEKAVLPLGTFSSRSS